ncbi:MAG: bifunctional adenosylcobinamide kinase/adenosylcobinamide-phosphate guanylyltransferase [Ruminococcus sp.]|uniref:bifunctional adenosylcobinamide kinase/adenosylcobinamide-phosphate guanylyltransferase n=1 Tax=Ruminococcus sp. TaxID=41978 RepID=UPI0025FD597D|nr:bifunctional adenosylcobinamide kinase/adenosylcobinamide-phosphate guanylyltransferase [Ruminococcus sp.]MBR5683624.1 bifunctional adenosylcobinamide kinase/adenosylcobinamide-phosphate guanylyltransferase [Ruminococcus sp.]
MKFVVGGAYQGKTAAACELFGFDESEIVNGSVCVFEEAFTAKCINSYHRLIERLIAEGASPLDFTKKLCAENGNAVIIMDEIGCGIVPVEKSERRRREETGRCGCMISSASDTVVRVICGIPVFLKGGRNED